MTRFVVDTGTVLRLLADEVELHPDHRLLAPTLLRSQVLAALYEAVRAGDLDRAVARDQLARLNRLPIRYLGDAVLRRRAWDLADRLSWASTYDAEFVALTQLQADALVSADRTLAERAAEVIETAPIEALSRP